MHLRLFLAVIISCGLNSGNDPDSWCGKLQTLQVDIWWLSTNWKDACLSLHCNCPFSLVRMPHLSYRVYFLHPLCLTPCEPSQQLFFVLLVIPSLNVSSSGGLNCSELLSVLKDWLTSRMVSLVNLSNHYMLIMGY